MRRCCGTISCPRCAGRSGRHGANFFGAWRHSTQGRGAWSTIGFIFGALHLVHPDGTNHPDASFHFRRSAPATGLELARGGEDHGAAGLIWMLPAVADFDFGGGGGGAAASSWITSSFHQLWSAKGKALATVRRRSCWSSSPRFSERFMPDLLPGAGQVGTQINLVVEGSLLASLGWILCSLVFAYGHAEAVADERGLYRRSDRVVAILLWAQACAWSIILGACWIVRFSPEAGR